MSDKHNSKYAVEMHNVSKIYTLKTKDKTKKKERFYALKDVSFQVEKGDQWFRKVHALPYSFRNLRT